MEEGDGSCGAMSKDGMHIGEMRVEVTTDGQAVNGDRREGAGFVRGNNNTFEKPTWFP